MKRPASIAPKPRGPRPRIIARVPGLSYGGLDEHLGYVLRRAQLTAQIFRPRLQTGFVKITRPVRGDGKFVVHDGNLAGVRVIATRSCRACPRFLSEGGIFKRLVFVCRNVIFNP